MQLYPNEIPFELYGDDVITEATPYEPANCQVGDKLIVDGKRLGDIATLWRRYKMFVKGRYNRELEFQHPFEFVESPGVVIAICPELHFVTVRIADLFRFDIQRHLKDPGLIKLTPPIFEAVCRFKK